MQCAFTMVTLQLLKNRLMPSYVECTDIVLLARYMTLRLFYQIWISSFLIRCAVTHTALTHCYLVTKLLYMALGTENITSNYLLGTF